MNKKKHVIVIHGGEVWNTHQEYIEHLISYDFTREKFEKVTTQRWKDRLQSVLGKQFLVVKPEMPCSRNAKYDEWVIWFEKVIPYIEDDCVLVGHSLGANFLAKYLALHDFPVSIAQLHLVAGCFGIVGGFDLPESLKKIERSVHTVYIYHSHDDPVVEFADALKYSEALPDAQLIAFSENGHFIQEEFPELVDNVRKSLI